MLIYFKRRHHFCFEEEKDIIILDI